MRRMNIFGLFFVFLFLFGCSTKSADNLRTREDFGWTWMFHLGDFNSHELAEKDTAEWRIVDLPHDWSIEGSFSKDNPATISGGALPGGVGWYKKIFTINESDKDRMIFIEFDGVYRNSEVWINGQYLGKRPYGYSSFRYNLSPYLNVGNQTNTIVVRVDNSQQPNSRWYSGSGIYRNIWLVKTDKVSVDHWGTYITTPQVSRESATISLKTKIRNYTDKTKDVMLSTVILDENGNKISEVSTDGNVSANSTNEFTQEFKVNHPSLWSVNKPILYKAISTVIANGKKTDNYETSFGIRTFSFDVDKGFILNGQPIKILGVCNHHDLGCLGSAINVRALERQLEMLKDMGCNAIRTSHNPPAPELLDLCDRMGFLVMDEAFDMWKIEKTSFDYHLDWDEWHVRDLSDMVLRDRNHPSVILWSIGNEIPEQWQPQGFDMAKELSDIVKSLDPTRPIISACNNPVPENNLLKSGSLDLVGFNYNEKDWVNFHKNFPGQKFIATETTSALATRGHYDMPADEIRVWPFTFDQMMEYIAQQNFSAFDPNVNPFTKGNPDNTCSSYDNCHVPWGSTHEDSWRLIKKYDFLSGLFIWTGWDYLGEPTPYSWPSRSSYFGIIDLAGFPKDAFYLYQSEWTNKPVLHILPHWNWEGREGQPIDVWVYSNCKEVELFLNDKSLGKKSKASPDELHLAWKVPYEVGTLRAVGKIDGKPDMITEIKTAGVPAKITLKADRNIINATGRDLSFVTVSITDKDGNLVPTADNLVKFVVTGCGSILAVDNGSQTSAESFQAPYRKAYNGLCLAVIKSDKKAGEIKLEAKADGLQSATLTINVK